MNRVPQQLVENSQLVVLQSSRQDGVIDVDVNDQIVLERFSQVAVHSLTVDTLLNSFKFQVTTANNEITFSFTTLGIMTAQIAPALYTTVQNLQTAIQNAINDALTTTGGGSASNIGMECQVPTIVTSTMINFTQSPLADPTTTGSGVSVNLTNSGGTYSPTTPGTVAYLGDGSPLCQGYGMFRCRVLSVTAGSTDYVFGLQLTSPADDAPTTGTTFFGIEIDDGGDIFIINNGTVDPTSVGSVALADGTVNSDQFTIVRAQGFFTIFQYVTAAKDPIELAQVPATQNTAYYPFFLFTNGAGSVNYVRTTPSPFLNNAGSAEPASLLDGGEPGIPSVGVNPPTQSTSWVNRVVRLAFSGDDLASALGFLQTSYQQVVNSPPTFSFAAESATLTTIPTSIIVVCDSFRLSSFRGGISAVGSGASSILDVVPFSANNGPQLNYVSQRFFLSINNASPITTRRLVLRLLRPDFSPVSCAGTTQIVLLFRSGKNLSDY